MVGIRSRKEEGDNASRKKKLFESPGSLEKLFIRTFPFENLAHGQLTESRDVDLGGHPLVVGVDALASVRARVLLATVLDEKHDGRVARLLLGVDPGVNKFEIRTFLCEVGLTLNIEGVTILGWF